jgi:hypothetical protein
MIPKSGCRFSDKIMLSIKKNAPAALGQADGRGWEMARTGSFAANPALAAYPLV